MFLNRLVGFFVSPLTIGILLVLAGAGLQLLRKRRAGLAVVLFAAVWFWVWSMPAFYLLLGYGLERGYPPQRAEAMPEADAIVVLGGGMGCNTNLPYAEMWSSADRVWHAARLYRAGKAPVVIPSGAGDQFAALPLLVDLGVPRKAIRVEAEARNTEENALLVERFVRRLPGMEKKKKPRVLVVTSAWHMRRALLNFQQTGLEAMPASADHEATTQRQAKLSVKDFLPAYDRFYMSCVMAKEYAGYWLYRGKYLLRPPAKALKRLGRSGRNDDGKSLGGAGDRRKPGLGNGRKKVSNDKAAV